MPLPSFLQAMFTPQRSGPGQMAWRDRDVGEGSGEISQGDIQEMYWKRGPAARGHGQQMDSAVRPQEGLGQSGAQEVAEGISKMTGLEPGGMSSITEVMQATPVGDEFGGAPAMGYATPSDPMGGGLDRMLGDSRFGGGMSSSTFGDPTADELGIGGGSGSALGPGLADMETMSAFDAPMTPPAPSMSMGGYEGEGSLGPDIRRGTTPPHSSAHGFMSGGGFPGSMGPGGVSMGSYYPIPSTTIGNFLKSLFGGSGPATGNPLQRGQLGPLSEQGQAAVSASQASAPFGRDRFGRPRTQ